MISDVMPAEVGVSISLEMFSASGQVADFPQSSFSDLKREDLRATTCVRIPGSGDFLITVEPTDERGPVFIVQQQQGKQLLHVDALAQQSGDTLNTFLNAPGEASIVAYVLAMPSQTQLPVEGLEGWSKVDISPAFPGNNPRRFVASARPDGAAAGDLIAHELRRHVLAQRDEAHFRGDLPATGVGHLRAVLAVASDACVNPRLP